MKTPLSPLSIALLLLLLASYTSAAPTTVQALDLSYEPTSMSESVLVKTKDLLSPRSATYSPASDRRTAPSDICQPGRSDSVNNPICNPDNYSRVSPFNGGGESNDSTNPSTLNGHSREGRVKRRSMLSRRRQERTQGAKEASLVSRNRDGERRICQEDQDPQATRSEPTGYKKRTEAQCLSE